jgi:hypothetical protein
VFKSYFILRKMDSGLKFLLARASVGCCVGYSLILRFRKGN